MKFFGIGGPEIVLIFLIMLIVAGPKRMIGWAYIIGQYVGKFRILWEQMVDMVQQEVDEAGLDVKIPRELPTRQNITKQAGAMLKPFVEPMEATLDEMKQPLQETMNETDKVIKDTQRQVKTSAKVDMGTWKKSTKKASTATNTTASNSETTSESTAPESKSNGFGAWSNPKSTSQQVEQEA